MENVKLKRKVTLRRKVDSNDQPPQKKTNKLIWAGILGLLAVFVFFGINQFGNKSVKELPAKVHNTSKNLVKEDMNVESIPVVNKTIDSDGDGQTDAAEVASGSNPTDATSTYPDADNDGLSDVYEKVNNLNANDASDGTADNDGDGLSNFAEMIAGSKSNQSDSDGDGQTDGAEVASGSNPTDAASTYTDTDNDGLSDAYEKANNLNANDASDGKADNDGDGLSNFAEMIAGSNLNQSDSDGDGQTDAAEVASGSNPTDAASTYENADNDGLNDDYEKANNLNSNSGKAVTSSGSNTESSVNSIKNSGESDINITETKNVVSGKNKPLKSTFILSKSRDDIYYFKIGSSIIDVNDSKLNGLAKELKENSKINIILVGHTDGSGSDQLNMTLSRSRAKKIFEFLKGKGISSSRMIIEAKGESAPKYDNNSSNKYKNRRVEFIKN